MAESGRPTVLIVDDEEGIRHGLSRLFEQEGFAARSAENAAEALDATARNSVDIAILDIRLKGGRSGLELLDTLRQGDPALPIVMVTGYGSIESAIEAMKRGASDYILKPIENATLLDVVRRNLEIARLRKDNDFLRSELLDKVYSHEIITRDPVFLSVVEKADRIKDSDATLLITGESGTGKEVLARYVHFTGARRAGPFVSINCAALSETLLLSELFGHEKGSFTGAVERRIGKFELADKGTLFLDEIGDMAPGVQAKLLRVLEENAFERVGGTKRIAVDIRVIAATNRDLAGLMGRGEFRSDLYYRIAIMELRLPPLRQRRGDIPLLVDHFVKHYAAKYRKPVSGPSRDVAEFWGSYDWPGNVRELRNAVNQAVLLCKGEVLDRETVGPRAPVPSAECGGFDPGPYGGLEELGKAAAAYYERVRIREVLERTGGNQSRTAAELAVTRKTLARKIEAYGLRDGLAGTRRAVL